MAEEPRVKKTCMARQVYAEYGMTMQAAQWFELALVAAAYEDPPEPSENASDYARYFDEANELIRTLEEKTGGQLKAELAKRGGLSEDLMYEVAKAVDCRNRLAHGYFASVRGHLMLTDLETHGEAIEELRKWRRMFGAVNERLTAWMCARKGETP